MIFIVLPAYNEQDGIQPLLERIDLTLKESHSDYKIFLVDDGSTDATRQKVESLQTKIPVEIISHEKNKGLGESIKTGLFHAVKAAADHDVIVTMDADNTHVPGLISRLNRNIWEGCGLVIASRYVRDARVIGVPMSRRFLGYGASFLFRLFFPIPGVRDYTCGYRAYQSALLKRAFDVYGDEFVSEPGFSCQIDILLKLALFHPVINEVPIILKYDARKGASKMQVVKTVGDTLKLFARRLTKQSRRLSL
ncbi:MAG: glycosyltransferase family 2 protein [Deltaproteobacteria bacterium]|nr:glycosyltransferase family 2 protein [Deltaproteobacteria bacterium]